MSRSRDWKRQMLNCAEVLVAFDPHQGVV